jgi:hypothetical protein
MNIFAPKRFGLAFLSNRHRAVPSLPLKFTPFNPQIPAPTLYPSFPLPLSPLRLKASPPPQVPSPQTHTTPLSSLLGLLTHCSNLNDSGLVINALSKKVAITLSMSLQFDAVRACKIIPLTIAVIEYLTAYQRSAPASASQSAAVSLAIFCRSLSLVLCQSFSVLDRLKR